MKCPVCNYTNPEKSVFCVDCGSYFVSSPPPIAITFDTVKIKDDQLRIVGFIRLSSLSLENVSISLCENAQTVHCIKINKAYHSNCTNETEDNNFGCFNASFNLSEYNKFSLCVKTDCENAKPSVLYSYRCVVNNTKTLAACGKYTVALDSKTNSITIKQAVRSELKSAAKNADIATLRESKGSFVHRTAAKLTKRKDEIWLYCDRENIFDNAYDQFRHDFDKDDGVQRYYIINSIKNNDTDKCFTPKQKKYLVEFRSFKHRILFLNSSKILTSFNSISIISPFGNLPLRWYSDMMNTEIIYLQHGVLHASLPGLYSKEKANADKIVISSEFEKKNFCENYHFSQEDLLFSGMPRFDSIDVSKPAQRKILFSPSWRKNLIGEYIGNTRTLHPEKFLASPFCTQINAFLNSTELADLLEKYNLTLDFKNHPIFSCYDEYIRVDNPRINVTQENINMQDYLAMITDYSSVVFDFVYLSRPIIYFVPDYDQFRAGLTHGYSKLDLPLEEGFGDIAQTGEDLIKAVKAVADNDFKANPIYQKRMDEFFGERDTNHRERLYNLIK